MEVIFYLVTFAILALAFSFASAYDPSPLQDFCVAINNTDSAGMYMHALSLLLLAVRSSIIICIRFFPYMTCYCPLLHNCLISEHNKLFFCVVFVN